jgi:hypothetical protein
MTEIAAKISPHHTHPRLGDNLEQEKRNVKHFLAITFLSCSKRILYGYAATAFSGTPSPMINM